MRSYAAAGVDMSEPALPKCALIACHAVEKATEFHMWHGPVTHRPRWRVCKAGVPKAGAWLLGGWGLLLRGVKHSRDVCVSDRQCT